MKTVITRDDVTGAEVSESAEVEITIGDVSGTLDLSPDSLSALVSLANGEGPAKLAALLAPAVAPAIRRSGTRKTSGGTRDGKSDEYGFTPEQYREHATRFGIAVNARGRVPDSVKISVREALAGESKSAPAVAPVVVPRLVPTPDGAPATAPESAPASGKKVT